MADRVRLVARRVKQLIEPIAACPFSSPESMSAYSMRGVSAFFPSYVWSRAAPLGEVSGEVVVAVFGPFRPDAVRAAYTTGRTACTRAAILEARDEAAQSTLQRLLPASTSAQWRWLADTLERVALALDPHGAPMFAARAALDVPSAPDLAAWRWSDAIREHRGDAHTAAWRASGLDALSVNLLTAAFVSMPFELRATLMGFTPAEAEAGVQALRDQGLLDGDLLSERGRAVRSEIEAAVDRQQAVLAGCISDDLLGELETVLAPWGAAVVAAGAYPAPPEIVFPS